MNNYAIIGKGGLHDIIIDILGEKNYLGFYDDKENRSIYYLGKVNQIKTDNIFLAIGSISNMLLREKIINELKIRNKLNTNAISKKSNISNQSSFGNGNIVLPFVQIGVNTSIGDGNIIFTNSVIEHDSKIGNNVNIAPGVNIAGNVTIGNNVYIGLGVNIIDGLKIGKNSVIGAGSTVLSDIEENSVYVGSPAKKIKNNDLYKSIK